MLNWYVAVSSGKLSTDGTKYGPYDSFDDALNWLDRNPYIKSGYNWVIFSERKEKANAK